MRGLRAIEELFASHIVSNLNKLSKEQLIKYLPDVKKSSNKKDLLIIMQNRITNRELSIEDIYNENKELFALTSNKLEEILKLNKPFFNWIKKHRKVKVVQIEKMELYGKVVAVPFWCAKDAYYLVYNSKRLKLLEEEFTSEKEKSKKTGLEKKKTTLKKNNDLRDTFKNEYKEMINKWQDINKEGALYLELAYWTMWASRWAKTYVVKYRKTKNISHHLKSEEYYKLKSEALKIFANSQYSYITIVKPEHPERVKVNLCEIHKEMFCEDKADTKIIDFYLHNQDEINYCCECNVYKEESYYTLYHIKVIVDDIEDIFSFHIPYDEGNKLFENKSYPIEIGSKENVEGMFRYGRPVSDNEKITITESKIKKELGNAIERIVDYLKNK